MPETAVDYRDLPPLPTDELAKVTPPEKFSQSILAKWDTCHRSAFLYRKYRGGPQSPAMVRGEVFHRFVEESVQYLIEAGERSMPPEVAKPRIMELIREYSLPEYEQDALRRMAFHWANSTVIEPDRIVGLEEMIEMEVGPYTVRGKLDHAQISVLGHAEVDDYKTSLSMPSQDDLEKGSKGFQLKFYAALMLWGKPEGESLRLGEGINEVRARLVFPRFVYPEGHERAGEMIDREVTYTREQLTDFRDSLLLHCEQLEEAFETGKFQATDGSHCSECPAYSECPLPDALHSHEQIESMDQAIEVAKLIDFRDSEQRADRKALKEFCDENGIDPLLYNDDYCYAFRPEVSKRVNWKAVDGGPVRDQHVTETKAVKFARRKQTAEEKADA